MSVDFVPVVGCSKQLLKLACSPQKLLEQPTTGNIVSAILLRQASTHCTDWRHVSTAGDRQVCLQTTECQKVS